MGGLTVTEDRVIGPPGTGKTTFLTQVITHEASQRGSDAVVAVSHTRAAAAELAGRNAPIERDNIATLHALAYRAIDRPEVAQDTPRLREFAETYPQWQFSATRDPEDYAFGDVLGDDAIAEYGRLRNTLRPRELWPADILAFADAWERYKTETGTIDYSDMLEIAIRDTTCCTQDPEVMVVDEAQDMTRLQWQLVMHWAGAPNCEKLVTAGDPDQALYQWAGADTRWFQEHEPARRKVLEQSYRVPRAVHALALHWIRQCADREDVVYHPRDAQGSVTRSPATYQHPEALLDLIEDCPRAETSVMIMASCAYMLQPLIAMLRERGIPFSNPWRRKRGDWNPLHRGSSSTLAAIKAFCAPAVEGRVWTAEELMQWLALTKQVLKRGGKDRIEAALAADETEEAVLQALVQEMSEEDFSECLTSIPRNLDWLQARLKAAKQKPAEYPLQLIRQHGMQVVDEEPTLYVGTCHSFKGGEADTVVIFPDLSAKGLQSWLGTDRDSVLRLYYVALTRARENVILASAASGAAVW